MYKTQPTTKRNKPNQAKFKTCTYLNPDVIKSDPETTTLFLNVKKGNAKDSIAIINEVIVIRKRLYLIKVDMVNNFLQSSSGLAAIFILNVPKNVP